VSVARCCQAICAAVLASVAAVSLPSCGATPRSTSGADTAGTDEGEAIVRGRAPETAEPADPRGDGAGGFIEVAPGIRVDRASAAIEFSATAVLDAGFLEQYICTVGTRTHESLFAFDGKASSLHAAMLLAGLKPGAPGYWREVKRDAPNGDTGEDASFALELVAPTGDEVEITVVLPDGRSHPLTHFVRASPVVPHADDARPPERFLFAGSRFHRDQRTGDERYVADGSGSIVGLVTFGDELIGALEVIPDSASAFTPVWEVASERMPQLGTVVTIRVRRSPRSAAVRRTTCLDASASGIRQHAARRAARKEKRPGRDNASDRALPGAIMMG
jgi:hypothetical protein